MKMPKVIYVRIEKDGDNEYPLCWVQMEDAVDEDGPSDIGVYKLVETKRVRKVVSVVDDKKR